MQWLPPLSSCFMNTRWLLNILLQASPTRPSRNLPGLRHSPIFILTASATLGQQGKPLMTSSMLLWISMLPVSVSHYETARFCAGRTFRNEVIFQVFPRQTRGGLPHIGLVVEHHLPSRRCRPPCTLCCCLHEPKRLTGLRREKQSQPAILSH